MYFKIIGIDDNHWTIINSMHTNAKTSIKWKGYISESLNIEQGVHQGGILSADLQNVYKIYCGPTTNCLLAIIFSVLSSGNRNMLFKNVRAFMCTCI
jgi:hypothetical protein